jgi:FKBP-type peptidyl-prolyl cis-trans isomerase FkpA
MRFRHTAALLGAGVLLAACGSGPSAANARLDTEDQKASYGVGLNMGRSLQGAEDRLDRAAFLKGIEDAMTRAEPAIDQAEIQSALQAFSEALMQEQEARRSADAEKNQAEGAAYLAENGSKEGVTTTESGLQYEVLRQGDGPRPTASDRVSIHYKGTLIDGTQFDSSYDRGEPIEFGVGGVIPGFSEALQLMPVGSQYRVVIPGELGYGAAGTGGDIGPNATLIFEIELLEIVG